MSKKITEKITVAFEADPSKTYLVKPLGEMLAEKTGPIGDADLTGTVTGGGGDHQSQGDKDFDCGV